MDHAHFMTDQSKLWQEAFQRAPRKPDGGDWMTVAEISEKLNLSRNVVRWKLVELQKNGQIERKTFRIESRFGGAIREIDAVHYRFKGDSGLQTVYTDEPKPVSTNKNRGKVGAGEGNRTQKRKTRKR
jgi:DNA-binding Lrp family transcriptional regulator